MMKPEIAATTQTIQIREPHLLVVEGREEERFFQPLLVHMGLRELQVVAMGGKTQLRRRLEGLVLSRDFQDIVVSLGVVRDADDDQDAAFASVCGALEAANLPVPDQPMSIAGKAPQVLVMIMPGDGKRGALEDLCLASVEGDPALPCVEDYFNCLKRNKLYLPRNPRKLNKRKLYVFIASRKGDARLLGEAAEARHWDWDSPAFDEVKRFLQALVKTGP